MNKAPLFIGLAGYGTVGSGLAEVLHTNKACILRRLGREIRIKRVLERDHDKVRQSPFLDKGVGVGTDPTELYNDPDIALVVELMGGIDFPAQVIKGALQAGKHVVTANKALLAEAGTELFALAAQKGLSLGYEASVCGAIPIVQALRESLAGNEVVNITGILNGTSNYILSEMSTKGMPFDVALAEAQALGYAEAIPTLDIEGIDAAHKLTLLIRLAYGVDYPFAKLPVSGVKGMDPMQNTAKANIPVLLYVGDRDVRTPAFHARGFFNAIKGTVPAKFELIPDMPHSMPWYPRHQQVTLDLIEKFLKTECFAKN